MESVISLHTYLTDMPLFSLSKAPFSTLLSRQIFPLIQTLHSFSLIRHRTLALFFLFLSFFSTSHLLPVQLYSLAYTYNESVAKVLSLLVTMSLIWTPLVMAL